MMFYNQTHHFLSKRFIFFEKIPQSQFYCIFKEEFFKFSKFFVNRKPSARGTTLLGAFGPQKWEHPPPPSRKKILETTPKNRREQGFHSGGCNVLYFTQMKNLDSLQGTCDISILFYFYFISVYPAFEM